MELESGITLALGGIGLKGIASAGVLHEARELKISVTGLRATGISAVIAAYFALGKDPLDLLPRLISFFREHRRELWGLEAYGGFAPARKMLAARSMSYFLRESLYCRANLKRPSVFPWSLVEGGLREIFGDATTDDLEVPLAVGAVELHSGQEVMLREGPLVELVRIGVSVPGLFPPVEIGRRTYVSSVLIREVPLARIPRSERPVVALMFQRSLPAWRPRSILEILARADELRQRALTEAALAEADLVVEIPDRGGWASLARLPTLIEDARCKAREALHRLTGQ